MQLFYSLLRNLHIIAGSIALLSGPIAMFNQNGNQLHRLSGKIYFFAMLFIFTSSIVLSIHTGTLFLFMIGIFSLILVSTGYRALYLKKLHKGQKPALIDWGIVIIAALCGTSFLVWGSWMLFIVKNNFGITALVFGSIILRGVAVDYKRFTIPPSEKNHWLYIHISSMIGGYIATFTAFLVQNLHLGFIVWLLPTIAFTPFIFYTINKFKKKSKKGDSLPMEIRR